MQPRTQDQREGSTDDLTVDGPVERTAEATDDATNEAADDATDGAALDLAVLDGLAERSLQEHAEVYDQVHVQLQGALREIDDA